MRLAQRPYSYLPCEDSECVVMGVWKVLGSAVSQFSLTKEVLASLKTPANNPTQFLTPPMVCRPHPYLSVHWISCLQLALNNFSTENKASHLLSTVLQNMFPSISVHSVS